MRLPSAVVFLVSAVHQTSAFTPSSFHRQQYYYFNNNNVQHNPATSLSMSMEKDENKSINNSVINPFTSAITAASIFLFASTSPVMPPHFEIQLANAAETITITATTKTASKVTQEVIPTDPVSAIRKNVASTKEQESTATETLIRAKKTLSEATVINSRAASVVTLGERKVKVAKSALISANDRFVDAKARGKTSSGNAEALKSIEADAVRVAESRDAFQKAQAELAAAKAALGSTSKQLSASQATVTAATKALSTATKSVSIQESNLKKATERAANDGKVKAEKKRKAETAAREVKQQMAKNQAEAQRRIREANANKEKQLREQAQNKQERERKAAKAAKELEKAATERAAKQKAVAQKAVKEATKKAQKASEVAAKKAAEQKKAVQKAAKVAAQKAAKQKAAEEKIVKEKVRLAREKADRIKANAAKIAQEKVATIKAKEAELKKLSNAKVNLGKQTADISKAKISTERKIQMKNAELEKLKTSP